MALINIHDPQFHQPAWHPFEVEMDSDQKANTDFRYKVELNSAAWDNRVLYIRPRPVDGHLWVDVRRHAQDLLDSSTFDPNEANFQQGNFADLTIKVVEEWRDGAGNIVTGANYSFQTVPFDSAFNRHDWLIYDQDTYLLLDNTRQMLWSIENKTRVRPDDIFFINKIQQGTSHSVYFRVIEYFKNGTTNTIDVLQATTGRSVIHTLDLASKLTDPDNTVKIDVVFRDNGNTTDISETKTLFIQEHCSVYTDHRIIYNDRKGSYNSLNFDQASRKDTKVKSKDYKKHVNSVDETGLTRHITRYFVESDDEYEINGDFESEKFNSMYEDLIAANNVYLDVRNDPRWPDPSITFVPIEILTKSYKEKKSENQELVQFKLNFRFSWDKVIRR